MICESFFFNLFCVCEQMDDLCAEDVESFLFLKGFVSIVWVIVETAVTIKSSEFEDANVRCEMFEC